MSGIGELNPTALLDIAASTASRASLRLRTGSAPSSPNEGDIYSDGTDLFYYDGSSFVDLTAGSVGSLFTDGGAVTYLTSTTDDFAIGGTTLAASIFSIDESLGVFGFALDNSVDPILRFEGVSSTHTADLTFTAISDQILIDGLGGGLAVRGQAGTNSGELRLQEVSTSGSDYVGFKAPNGLSGNQIWTLPTADGTANQALVTNGSGVLSWSTSAGAWQLSTNVLNPSLATYDFAIGGPTLAASIFSIDESLGVFGFALDNSVDPILRFEGVSSTHTADLTFIALSDQILIDGLGGGLAVRGQAGTNSGELRLQEVSTSGSEYVGFKAPNGLTGNKIWTLPTADGTANQALVTNGSGVLSWSTSAGAWQLSTNVLNPSLATYDFAIGGPTLAASIFSIDESLGVFGFALDNSVDPILRFEGVGSTNTADLTFTALSDQILIDGLGGGLAVRGQAGTNSGELRLQEVSTNGSDYVGFKAPNSLTGNKFGRFQLLMEQQTRHLSLMVRAFFRGARVPVHGN